MPPLPPSRPVPVVQPRRRPILRSIGLVLLALIILTGLLVLIIWVIIQPKHLKYSVEHGSVSGYNLSNDHLNATFHFVLRANNPNKRVSLYYDRIEAKVLYDDQILATNKLQPFYQPRRNVTHLDLNFVGNDVALYGAVARDLAADRASGDVNLDLRIRAKIRLKVGLFKIHRKLKAICGPLTVPVSSSSKSFERVFCDVDID